MCYTCVICIAVLLLQVGLVLAEVISDEPKRGITIARRCSNHNE
jgi:hypothetical protein